MAARRLFLIDGPSLVYRAFFALPESIATSTGVPTNAIFGFASMLVKLVTDNGVCPTVVAWDAGTSGRTDVFPDYKSNRRSRPDLLSEQWPAMEPLVESFGYRNCRVEGYEADDVIASLAQRVLDADGEIAVTIVTGDRDMFQLIDDRGVVTVMATTRGITETKLYDRQAVIDRYGIGPEQIPDFYGLKGDTSDNIPGVQGIGEKTASELIRRFGSLEGVLENVDQISGPKRRQNLFDRAQDARLSKQLATIRRDVPVELDLDGGVDGEPDLSLLREFFATYELRDPIRRLEEALGEDRIAPRPAVQIAHRGRERDREGDGVALEVRTGVPGDIARIARGSEIALVVRPEPVPEGALFGEEAGRWRFALVLGAGAQRALTGQCDGPDQVVRACRELTVVAHDAKAIGIVPEGLVHDTMIGAYLLDPARRGYPLRELAQERGLACESGDPILDDAVMIARLADPQRQEITSLGLADVMTEIELPLISILRCMEVAGVRCNVDRLAEITARVKEEIATLAGTIFELAGEEFLISSPQQLGEILFVKLGLSRKRRGKTGFSTDARVLQSIRSEHEIVALIERWRELSTLIKTYLDVLPGLVDEQSRIHTTFLQTVAQTGRLSSTNPNMQNVPIRTALGREIRGCFQAREGMLLIAADYSQVELRILAHVADEPALKQIFQRGEDVHTATASQVFGVDDGEIDKGMRSKAKMINYGIVYGLSDFGLADRLNIPREEASQFIDAYLRRFPRVASFISETVEAAKREGYVTTLWGRRRSIPEVRAGNYQVRSLGERLAVNTVIQGTAADVIKLAMVRAHGALRKAGLQTRLILTIHDELLFEAPPGETSAASELIESEMLAAWEDRDPPLAVDIGVGQDWLSAK